MRCLNMKWLWKVRNKIANKRSEGGKKEGEEIDFVEVSMEASIIMQEKKKKNGRKRRRRRVNPWRAMLRTNSLSHSF